MKINAFKEIINSELANYELNWTENICVLNLEIDDLTTVLLFCKANLGFEFFFNLVVEDINDTDFRLTYCLSNPVKNIHLQIETTINKEDQVQSVSGIWKHAIEEEREANEMFGLKIDLIKNTERYLFAKNLTGHPLLKNFDSFSKTNKALDSIEKNITQTPSFKLEQEDIIFSYDIENKKVKNFSYEIGFKHFGLEKDCENREVLDIARRVGYLNSRYSMVWSMAWCQGVENTFSINIPEKAQGIRMIINELSRIKDHLYSLIKICFDIGYFDYITNLSLWYERTNNQLKALIGEKNPLFYNIVGGVKFDIPGGWSSTCLEYINQLEKDLSYEYLSFTKSKLWNEKLSCGEIPKRDAVEYGLSGFVLRSTGYNLDLRKVNPFYFYKDVSFEVPLGIKGHVYDRYLVLNEEIFQSIKILFQVLDNIPAGKVNNQDFELTSDKKKINSIWESPGGIISLDAIYENEKINRLKISSSSKNKLMWFKDNIDGSDCSDLELIWNSLSINMSEYEK